jgi:hypothetical protein
MGFVDALALSAVLKSEPDVKKALQTYSAERKNHVQFQQGQQPQTDQYFPVSRAAGKILSRTPHVRAIAPSPPAQNHDGPGGKGGKKPQKRAPFARSMEFSAFASPSITLSTMTSIFSLS